MDKAEKAEKGEYDWLQCAVRKLYRVVITKLLNYANYDAEQEAASFSLDS